VVTVAYTRDDDNRTKVYYEKYRLEQPGFTDKRDIPDIDLYMYNKFDELELINKAENGVLPNQFVTYMDISIGGMWERWGQFIDNSTNITLDMTFRNIKSDIEWVKKYNSPKIVTRSTFKLFGDEKCEADSTSTYYPLNNYISLDITSVDGQGKKVDYPYMGIDSSITLQSSESIADYIYDPVVVNGKSYIMLDSSILRYTNGTLTPIYKGINDEYVIKITGMSLKEVMQNP